MTVMIALAAFAAFFVLTYVAWRRYLWAAEKMPHEQEDTCPYSLTDVFGERHLGSAGLGGQGVKTMVKTVHVGDRQVSP